MDGAIGNGDTLVTVGSFREETGTFGLGKPKTDLAAQSLISYQTRRPIGNFSILRFAGFELGPIGACARV